MLASKHVRSLVPATVLNIRRYVEDRYTLARLSKPDSLDLRALPSIDTSAVKAGLAALPDDEWNATQRRIIPHLPPDDPGSVLPHERRALYALARMREPRNALEIGTFLGVSTAYLAAALEGRGSRLTTVDIADAHDIEFAKQYGGAPAARTIAEIGLHNIEFVQSDSIAFLATVQQQFDFVFLDGNHRAGRVYRELTWVLRRLAEDGLVVLHDVYPGGWPLVRHKVLRGPWLAGERLRREYGLKLLPVSHDSSLAVLTR